MNEGRVRPVLPPTDLVANYRLNGNVVLTCALPPRQGELSSVPTPAGNFLMIDTPPDRLAANAESPYYDARLLERGVGIRFNGAEKTNVEEYCVSEGWVRLTVGTTVDRFGKPMTIKLKGKVEPYFRDKA